MHECDPVGKVGPKRRQSREPSKSHKRAKKL